MEICCIFSLPIRDFSPQNTANTMPPTLSTHVIFSICPTCHTSVAEFAGHLLQRPELICARCHSIFFACTDRLNQAVKDLQAESPKWGMESGPGQV